jgi:glutamine amidotransferase
MVNDFPACLEPGGMSQESIAAPPREDALAEIAVVDYGLGNLRSATRGLERAGANVEITDDREAILDADGVVLPGVGAFREGVENAGPFRDALVEVANAGQPLFGICLGMQMLLTDSEEAERAGQGDVRGLDLVPGTNVRFDQGQKVPHMGWNELDVAREHPLVDGVDGEYAYFVHSYYAEPDDEGTVVATTDYGTDFPSVVANEDGNVFGTQFHPEKSGETGLRILRNFVELCADQ